MTTRTSSGSGGGSGAKTAKTAKASKAVTQVLFGSGGGKGHNKKPALMTTEEFRAAYPELREVEQWAKSNAAIEARMPANAGHMTLSDAAAAQSEMRERGYQIETVRRLWRASINDPRAAVEDSHRFSEALQTLMEQRVARRAYYQDISQQIDRETHVLAAQVLSLGSAAGGAAYERMAAIRSAREDLRHVQEALRRGELRAAELAGEAQAAAEWQRSSRANA